jgi:hypothetical protein
MLKPIGVCKFLFDFSALLEQRRPLNTSAATIGHSLQMAASLLW